MSAQYRVGAVSHVSIGALLSSLSYARAEGRLRWSSKKPSTVEGVIDVRTEVVGCADGRLRIYLLRPRPDRIHVQYLINGVPIRRLDVNDSHRQWRDTTHKHTYVPSTGTEDAYLPDDIPEVPLGPTVAPGTYRAVFEAFAAECFVELPADHWTEPGK